MTPPPRSDRERLADHVKAALRDAFLIGAALGGWIGYRIGRSTNSEAPPEK